MRFCTYFAACASPARSPGLTFHTLLLKPGSHAQNDVAQFADVCCLLAAGMGASRADDVSDLDFGSKGTGQGTFGNIQDMEFDANNQLYVLDGGFMWEGNWYGNSLIQKFSNAGQFLGQFSIQDPKLGSNNLPAHLVVDSLGDVYITQPVAGLVQEYGPAGTKLRDFVLPGAACIASRTYGGKEQILVVPYVANQTVAKIQVIAGGSSFTTPISLNRTLRNCTALTTDKAGNVYLLADTCQLYKFDPTGKLLAVLGQRRQFNAGRQRADQQDCG